MPRCADVAGFLDGVAARNVASKLTPADLSQLQQFQLLQVLSPDARSALEQQVAQLEQAVAGIDTESAERDQVAQQVSFDTRKTHSVLFHLEGTDKHDATLERLQQEQQAVQHLNDDIAQRRQAFSQLLVQRALLDSCCPYNGDSVALTTAGRVALRDLKVRLYRVSDQDFAAYWKDAQMVDGELWSIANQSSSIVPPLVGALPQGTDRTYLWAVAIGMSKVGGDAQDHLNRFVGAWNGVQDLSPNVENRMMSSEVLSMLGDPLDDKLQQVAQINQVVREMDVPPEASLGVASILLLGQRADGTVATDRLGGYLSATASFESAALLAIVNRDPQELAGRFNSLRNLFASWGASPSEDTELSSAYIAASELPLETVGPKMQIISKGISGYLQYPLVASAILSSIPVLEANETLNLLEKAYEILGQRTGPISQAEGICLAVRMIHGIKVQSVNELDPTAAARAVGTPNFYYGGMAPRIWMPVFIMHGAYYSTWSGIGGPHPAHIHTWGGGGWGGGAGG